jgi:hypothetical protein
MRRPRAPAVSAFHLVTHPKQPKLPHLQAAAPDKAPCMLETWYMIPRQPAYFLRHLSVGLTSDSATFLPSSTVRDPN